MEITTQYQPSVQAAMDKMALERRDRIQHLADQLSNQSPSIRMQLTARDMERILCDPLVQLINKQMTELLMCAAPIYFMSAADLEAAGISLSQPPHTPD